MDWLTMAIPWAMTLATVIMSLVTLSRNGRKDRKQEYVEESTKIHEIEQTLTRIDTKLDQVQVTLKETRDEIKTVKSDFNDLNLRVNKLEGEMKTVWIRIDEIKAKIEHYHEGA